MIFFFSGGDLHYHLSQHGVFSEKDMRFYAAEIILGLEHMHNRFVVYRDLKVQLLPSSDEMVCSFCRWKTCWSLLAPHPALLRCGREGKTKRSARLCVFCNISFYLFCIVVHGYFLRSLAALSLLAGLFIVSKWKSASRDGANRVEPAVPNEGIRVPFWQQLMSWNSPTLCAEAAGLHVEGSYTIYELCNFEWDIWALHCQTAEDLQDLL